MPERYAPAGPLALAFLAVTEERYADALDRLEQALALSPDGQRDLARRLAVRIALDGPPGLRARAKVIAESAG